MWPSDLLASKMILAAVEQPPFLDTMFLKLYGKFLLQKIDLSQLFDYLLTQTVSGQIYSETDHHLRVGFHPSDRGKGFLTPSSALHTLPLDFSGN